MRIFAAAILLAVLVVLGLSSPAQAQDFEQARKNFLDARASFDAGHYQSAAVLFQRAYDIVKDPVLLYNVGEAWERGGNGRKSVAAYRAYLTASPSAPDRVEVNRRIKHIILVGFHIPNRSSPGDTLPKAPVVIPPVATIPVAPVSPPVAETPPIRPAPIAPTPIAPTPIAPPPVAHVEEPLSLPAQLPYEEPRQPIHHGRPLWVGAWVSLGVTVAALGAGTALALTANSRANDLVSQQSVVLPNGQPSAFGAAQQATYNNTRDQGQLYANVAIGCFAVGGAAAVATTVLFILDSRRDRSHAMLITPAIGKGTAGLSFERSF